MRSDRQSALFPEDKEIERLEAHATWALKEMAAAKAEALREWYRGLAAGYNFRAGLIAQSCGMARTIGADPSRNLFIE